MENLEQQLGLSLTNAPQYKTLKVDNGDNKKGKNATGEFVYKKKDEAGNFIRETFGKKLKGVVLMSRARLMGAYKEGEKPWWTPEFNPLGMDIIYICKGSEVVLETNYKKLKADPRFTIMGSDGKKKNNFSYIAVLYLDDGSEVKKIELTGRSRGNWIDFSMKMNKAGNSFLKQITSLEIVENDEGGFECKFKKLEDIKDNKEVLDKAVSVLSTIGTGMAMLGSGKTTHAPEQEEEAEEVAPVPSEPLEEIKIEDIPW